MFEGLPQAANFDADDAVGLSVEILGSIENLGGDRVGLDFRAPPFEFLRDKIFQKLALPIACGVKPLLQSAAQLVENQRLEIVPRRRRGLARLLHDRPSQKLARFHRSASVKAAHVLVLDRPNPDFAEVISKI